MSFYKYVFFSTRAEKKRNDAPLEYGWPPELYANQVTTVSANGRTISFSMTSGLRPAATNESAPVVALRSHRVGTRPDESGQVRASPGKSGHAAPRGSSTATHRPEKKKERQIEIEALLRSAAASDRVARLPWMNPLRWIASDSVLNPIGVVVVVVSFFVGRFDY